MGRRSRRGCRQAQEARERGVKRPLPPGEAPLGKAPRLSSPCGQPGRPQMRDTLNLLTTQGEGACDAMNSDETDREGPNGTLATAVLPTCRAEWLTGLTACRSLVELGLRLAWGLKAGFVFGQDRARPTQAAAGPRGSLFPLPVSLPEVITWHFHSQSQDVLFATAVRCWVAVGCAATNRLYGVPCAGKTSRAGKVHAAALTDMERKVRRFLEGEIGVDFGFDEAVKDLREKKVSFLGEEISQPHALTTEQIQKGLPPKGHGGAIPILTFLRGRTRYLMEHPLESILAEADRGSAPTKAKVHIKKGSEMEVFKLMEDRGVIKWFPDDMVYADSRGQYLSGLFGVIKPGKYTETHLPVLRCIMNLIPVNGLFQVLRGDIRCLPSATSWIPLHVGHGEVVTMSQGDMHAAFYLFEMPACWSPFMCFNWRVKGRDLGFVGGDKEKWFRPCCRVLPMGWASSVGIMQAISREVLLSRGLPPELELRKGSPLPPWFTQVLSSTSATKTWWQVYLDNFMAGDVEDQGVTGKDAGLQELAMRAWSNTGILTAEDKQVMSKPEVTELGVRFDGTRGLLGSSPERLLKTIFVSLHHIMNSLWSKREAQIILGRWIFILQFRRAGMCSLARSWEVLEKAWPSLMDRQILQDELFTLILLGPLLQTDLTASYDGDVTVSDASESGGAAAMSRTLNWSGKSLVGFKNDLRLRPLKVPLLIISLFNGIGGAFRLYDILGLIPEGRISVDISRHGNRVTRTTWPRVIELHDVETLTRADVEQWAGLFPHISEVHFYAGFPCVHLSSARAFRRNLDGEGSSLFWKMLEVLSWVQDIFSTFCRVKFCVENVASMDEEARMAISDELEVAPVKLDPSDCLPYSRPRFAWCSETLYEMQGIQLWTEKEYLRAYLDGPPVSNSQWIRPGWSWEAQSGVAFPTFMKAIKRNSPPVKPAGLERTDWETRERWRGDQYRYPPYQYRPQFLLRHGEHPPRLLDSSEREILLGFGPHHTESCMSASDIKKSHSDFEDVRCSLCGDSFSILSFAVIAAQMSADFCPRMTPSQIIQRLGLAPGHSAHPSVAVPMTRLLSYGGASEWEHTSLELVQHLGLTVNHTGVDVRIDTGEIMGSKTPAHASVRAVWWQWKHLFKVHWKLSSHINYLEMKMILNTLLWKCRDASKVNRRWLHLEDSMVCLYILSKGRTSSHLLQPLCRKIGAIQLAMGSTCLHAHVGSAENPTDAASRT